MAPLRKQDENPLILRGFSASKSGEFRVSGSGLRRVLDRFHLLLLRSDLRFDLRDHLLQQGIDLFLCLGVSKYAHILSISSGL